MRIRCRALGPGTGYRVYTGGELSSPGLDQPTCQALAFQVSPFWDGL